MADRGSIWDMPRVATALRKAGALPVTFAMCALGAKAQKWTTIAASGALGDELQCLARFVCPHGDRRHPERARGRDSEGRSRSKRAAAYPHRLCELLTAAILRAVADPARRAPAPGEEGPGDGRIGSGAELGPVSRAACEAASLAPPPFASHRNEADASTAELKRSPYPYDSSAPMQPKRPERSRR